MDWLGIRRLPFLSRSNFYYEFLHMLPWSVLAGLVESQFASVVVANAFHGSPRLIAAASSTPYAAQLLSLVWGMLCVGRRKVPLLLIFGAGTALAAGTVAAIPASPTGGLWFVVQMAAAQCFLSGVVTVRSALWKSNYPQELRGQITARIQRWRLLISVVTVLVAARVGDRDPDSYRYVFPCVAVIGLIGVALATRIHIRGERSELRRHVQSPSDGDIRQRYVEPYSLTALLSPGHVIGQMFRVLKEDRRYAHYCVAQALLGIANIMTVPIAVTLISRDLSLDDASAFWVTTGLIVAIPNLTTLLSVGRWGRLFDRLGVLRMRMANVACWVASLFFGFVGTMVILYADRIGAAYLPLAVLMFAGRAVGFGLGTGGGALAWNLGHLHFAEPQKAEIYMGIHVSLTGVRGLIAPITGVWLWHTIGWLVWLVAIALALASEMIYSMLARSEGEPVTAPNR